MTAITLPSDQRSIQTQILDRFVHLIACSSIGIILGISLCIQLPHQWLPASRAIDCWHSSCIPEVLRSKGTILYKNLFQFKIFISNDHESLHSV